MTERKGRAPWVVWSGDQDARCTRCKQRIGLPWGCSITTFVAYIRAIEREHADCRVLCAQK